MQTDAFNLARFLAAQAGAIDTVRAELRAGRKTSHWMWFVFPQIAGLGHSAMAQRYAIASLAEAKAYAAHPVLGARLRECAIFVLAHRDKTVHDIFGSPDDLKFHSSVTLFAAAAPDDPVFRKALDQCFSGRDDRHTRARLAALPAS
jgi:uncharacterized protein (DUF1810 family)